MDEKVMQEFARRFEDAMATSLRLFWTWRGAYETDDPRVLDFFRSSFKEDGNQHLIILPCCPAHLMDLLQNLATKVGLCALLGRVVVAEGGIPYVYVPCPAGWTIPEYLKRFGLAGACPTTEKAVQKDALWLCGMATDETPERIARDADALWADVLAVVGD